MKTYQELAARTLNGDPDHTPLERLANMLWGLAGEASEMQTAFYTSKDKFKDEAGDFRWYYSGVHSCLTFLEPTLNLADPLPSRSIKAEGIFMTMFLEIGKLQELAKKRYFHKKPIEDFNFRYHLENIFICWLWLVIHSGLSQEEVEAANIAKLEKRYPNGFNTADSLTRRDEATARLEQ